METDELFTSYVVVKVMNGIMQKTDYTGKPTVPSSVSRTAAANVSVLIVLW